MSGGPHLCLCTDALTPVPGGCAGPVGSPAALFPPQLSFKGAGSLFPFPVSLNATPPTPRLLISHQTARSRVKVTCVLLAKRALFNTRGSGQQCSPGGLNLLKCCLSFRAFCFPRVETLQAGVEDQRLPGYSRTRL